MKRMILAAFVIAAGYPAAAETPLTPTTAKATSDIVNKFFSLIKNGQVEQAYASIFSPKMIQDKRQDLTNITGQTSNTIALYGVVVGWESIHQDQISPYFAKVTYELRLNELPQFFQWNFYRRDDSSPWTVSNVSFNDNQDSAPK